MLQLQHNIVNILYSIKGLSESHLLQAEEGLFRDAGNRLHHAEEILEKARKQAERAIEITRRLGQILRTDNPMPDKPAPVSIMEIWNKTKRALRDEFLKIRIEVVERVPEDFPFILCQKEALFEIFHILARNAYQALMPEGKLIIRAQIGISLEEKRVAVISISDTGPGISQEKMGSLFQPFFTTKTPQEGNGLGLYLVRLLIQKNGGRVSASSFNGCGTTFTLELPIAEALTLPAVPA